MSCQKENFMYRCVNKLAPVYLCNMFTPRTLSFDPRDYMKRSGASLWSDLPEEPRTRKVEPLHSGLMVNILYHNIIYLVSIFFNESLVGFSIVFIREEFLRITSGIDEPGPLNGPVTISLLVAWILVYFCIWKGVRTTGKVITCLGFNFLFPMLRKWVL